MNLAYLRNHPSRIVAVCLLAVGAVLIVLFTRLVDAALAGPAANESRLATPDPSTSSAIADRYGKLPLRFEPNEGQSDRQVKFLSRGPGYDLFLTANEAVLTLRKPQPQPDNAKQPGPAAAISSFAANKVSLLRLQMIGANPTARVEGRDELPGKVNYLIGDDQDNWHTNIPTYLKVHYADVYPGIDLVYYGNRTELEYDFVVAPGANLDAIKFRLEGADRISLDDAGDLQVKVDESEVRLRKPVIYQLTDKGDRQEVKGTYVLKGRDIGFKIGEFDKRKPLIIDPVLSYSTLIGGGNHEYAYGIAVDSQGNAYVTGNTNGGGFPTTSGAFQPSLSGGAFVSKLDPTGTNLVYSTYLGGNNNSVTSGNAIAVDGAGSALVTGWTLSADFPTANAIRGGRNNLLKTTDGGSQWTPKNLGSVNSPVLSLAVDPVTPSTIYAGTNGTAGIYKSTDSGVTWTVLNTGFAQASCAALAIDPSNTNIIYAGLTPSIFSGRGVHKSTDGGNTWTNMSNGLGLLSVGALAIDPQTPATLYAGTNNGLYKSINGGGSWEFSTYLIFLGTGSIVVDPLTPATVYATTGGGGVFKTTNNGANWSQVNTGLTNTNVRTLAIDPTTPSTIYAGTAAGGMFKTTNGGGNWGVINNGLPSNTQVNASILSPTSPLTLYLGTITGGIFKTTDGGNSWTTVFTTVTSIRVNALAIDPGATNKVYAGLDSATGSQSDLEAFVTKLNASGSGLVYSTYLGGSGQDSGYGIAVGADGAAYITGETFSANFVLAGAFQSSCLGSHDAFVTKLDTNGALVYSSYLGGSNSEAGRAIAVDPMGNAYLTGSTNSTDFPLLSPIAGNTGSFYVTKVNAAGSALAYSSVFPAGLGAGIAVDSSGSAFVTGQADSGLPTTPGVFQTIAKGTDAFVMKLNSAGSSLLYSTYLGGLDADYGRGIGIDNAGNAYVGGIARSIDFPVVAGAIRTRSPFFKTTDGGLVWSKDNYGLGGILYDIAINPPQPSTIYAGTEVGVFKSSNAGYTWNAIGTGLANLRVNEVIVDPVTPSNMYAYSNIGVAASTNGVYRSTDSGGSWIPVKTGMTNTTVQSLAIDSVTPTTLYAGTFNGSVYKTTDSGSNWVAIGNSGLAFLSISVDPSNSSNVYGASPGGGLFKSVDAGANWVSVGFNQTGQFAGFIGVNSLVPSTLFAASSQGLFRSLDSGNTWTKVRTQGGKLAFDPFNPATVYLLTSSEGVLKSTDNGQTWQPLNGVNTGFATALIVNPAKPSTIYLATAGSGGDNAFVSKLNPDGTALIYSTMIGGSSAPSSGTTDHCFGIAVDSAGNAYATGQSFSADFATTPSSYQPFNRGFSDAFITKLTMSYVISGQVLDGSNAPVSGAEVTLLDGASLSSVLSEADGSYHFSHLREGGSFTVSAAKPHFTMAPQSQTFNNLTSNQTLNFTATATNAPFYTINGTVTHNSVGLSGVTVTLSGSQAGLTTTDANGNYSFTLAGGGNYIVTPSILGFTFTPSSQTFNNLGANQTGNFASTRQNFVVTNTNNHGTGSLRQAILDANATIGTDTIVFNIPGSGVQTINLVIALPEITEPVVIDGTTQPGYAGTPLIELFDASTIGIGLSITSGGSTIRGLAISWFGAGITLSGNGNNVIQGNYIGISPSGTAARTNGTGIQINSSSNNLIGGTTAAARNIISANASGIVMSGSGNQISGNFIGTNPAGTVAFGNFSVGIETFTVVGPPPINNVIGGTAAGAGNLIAGGNNRGILLNASGMLVQGNLIGTDISGTVALGNAIGISSTGAGNVIGGTVPGARNIISGNTSDGVIISGASRLEGNFIGTDITGTIALGNGGNGVNAGNGALIGGTTPEARNIISANGGSPLTGGFGNISLGSNNSGSQATVQGNYIGTDVTGNVALNNPRSGISISSSSNLIGGLVPGAQNVISGNSRGISLGGNTSAVLTGNTIQGNIIGLNALGIAPMPNSLWGIAVSGSANNNLIGGDQNGAGNQICFNDGPGVVIFSGTGNLVRGNSIFSNTTLGMDLTPTGTTGLTPNDLNDADTGGNNLQNFPVLTSATSDGATTAIQGTLNSAVNTTFRIDFYSNAACDPSGNGEGAQVMGNTSVTTDANGNAVINANLPVALASGRVVTATGTDPGGNTSEFSACSSGDALGSVHFNSATYFALEDVVNLTLTVVRSGGSKGTLSVNYSTANGTAIAGSDYSAASGSLVFADGETSKMLTIPIVDDGVTEPTETLRVTLSGVSDLERLGSPHAATVNIQDSSTTLYLIINPVNPQEAVGVLEGDSGTTNAIVPVGLSAATGRTVTADFTTISGSAISGVDFTPVSGTLTFAPGVTERTFSFPIIGDTLNENNELVQIVLSNPTNAAILSNGTVQIINDDPLPGLSINDVSVNEGNSGTTIASLTVSLSPVSGRTVRVNYATANGTATAGSDFVTTSGQLIFNVGETSKTISVTVNGETTGEADETFFVDLSAPIAASITRARGTGTITNDDGGTVQFSTTNYSKSEGGGSTNITVTRTGDTSAAASVEFRTGGNSFVACNVLGGAAVQNCDFVVSAGTLNFAAGQTSRTFPVMIYDDAYLEGDETLSLTLMNPVGTTLGTPSAASLMILDNDSPGAPSIAPKTFVATLSPDQEVPPTGTNGKGGGVVKLDALEANAKVGLIFSHLSSAETDAHIHGPAAAGANAPAVFPLPLGTVNGFDIAPTPQQVADFKANLHYMNVHTSNFPNGEVRGQLLWNPLNEAQYFVQQHYFDFLGRLPDQGGLDYWTNELTICGTDVQCLRDRTVGVSNAFFYEDEYQQTASYVFLLYRASFGNTQPFPNPDPANPTEATKLPRYLSFVRDRAQVVGGSGLPASQLALATNFVQRPEFIARYPLSLTTGAQFVDAVLATIATADGATFTSANRTALITHFNNGGRGLVMFHLANDYWNGCSRLPGSPAAPCVPAGFGAAVDNRAFIDAEYNRSFVYSQYSGYLRRDSDIDGFIFWLNQVSGAPPRNVDKQHGMVCAFITSAEYQLRFGNTTPRTNAECVP